MKLLILLILSLIKILMMKANLSIWLNFIVIIVIDGIILVLYNN